MRYSTTYNFDMFKNADFYGSFVGSKFGIMHYLLEKSPNVQKFEN